MMKINRSHLEGTVVEPRWNPSEPFWPMPCMHDSTRVGYHSAASMVAHLRPGMPAPLRQVFWSSFSNPCVNVFKPFYLNGPHVPANLAEGTSTYAENSPWWWANRVKLLCDLNYRAVAPGVREVFDATERWEMDRQAKVEAEARRLLDAGKHAEAVRLLQGFQDENCARVEKEYRRLGQSLPAVLKAKGIEYLHLDYMKSWTSRSKVPLPLEGGL
jgi:dipeptidase